MVLSWVLLAFYFLVGLGVVDFAAWLILIYRSEAGFAHSPTLNGFKSESKRKAVAAIIAARNEQDNIAECVQNLLSQQSVESVVVVDDGSEDDTYAIASRLSADGRVRVFRLGVGRGKAEACHYGAAKADCDWLLFVDADTRLRPGAVDRALAFSEEKGLDALSLIGELRCSHFWDKVSTPFLFGLLNSFIPLGDVCDMGKKSAYFYGSFILIRRDAYFKIGGHRAVRDEIVEDRALGSLAKRSGLKVCIARASKLVSAEWAPGFKEGVRAMERVAVPSMRGRVGLGAAFSFALTALFFIPIILLAVSLYGVGAIGGASAHLATVLGVLSLLSAWVLSMRSAQMIGSNPLYTLLFPIPELIFSYALWSSVDKVLRGKPVVWRGRKYVFGKNAGEEERGSFSRS